MPLRKSSCEAMPPAFAGAVNTPGLARRPTPRLRRAADGSRRALADQRRATLPKNSPAIRFDTEVSIRWPTPPTMPPTTASAS